MAVRFDASGEHYTRTLTLGSQAAFSVSMWARLAVDRNTWGTFLAFQSTNSILLQVDNDGTSLGIYSDSTGTTVAGPTTLTVGTWYYIAYSVQPGTNASLLYARAANSSTPFTDTWTQTAWTLTTLWLANNQYSEWINGNLAAVKVWTAGLTQAELELEATQYQPQRLANLQAFYPLVKPETTDYSGNARTLTGGTGTTTESGPPIPWWVTTPRLILPSSAGGSVTGTVAVTQAAQTSAATGQLGYTGTSARTQAANTSTATGTVAGPVTGTAAATQVSQTATAAGQLGYSGTVARAQAAQTASGAGTLGYSGTSAAAQAAQTSTAAGQLGYTGTVARTQAAQTSAATGTFTAGGSFAGSAAAIQANQVAAAAGKLGYTGTGAPAQASNTSAAAGTVVNPVTGTAAAVQVDQVAAAAGILRYTATSTATQAPNTASGQGVFFIPITGTLAEVQANQTASASGTALGDIVERPNQGSTTRPSSGITPRPFAGVAERP